MKEKHKKRIRFSGYKSVCCGNGTGIAAGSARVVPPNNGGVVQEEWMQGDDDNRTIEW